MDELEQLRADCLARRHAQNARRAKKGLKPMHPELLRAPKKKRAAPAVKKAALPAPESGDEEETALSFEEWSGCGFSVRKGEKCHCFDINGVPQFLRTQVRKHNPAWEKYRKRHS